MAGNHGVNYASYIEFVPASPFSSTSRGALKAVDPDDPELAALRHMVSSTPPADVAQGVFNAIRAQQLHMLTHPELEPLIRDRMEAILTQRNRAIRGSG